ncbi:unnamed protein product [Dicrocoelium dendriticum]|nr:unnamed protein product [Dicrocoelium dendriticum]
MARGSQAVGVPAAGNIGRLEEGGPQRPLPLFRSSGARSFLLGSVLPRGRSLRAHIARMSAVRPGSAAPVFVAMPPVLYEGYPRRSLSSGAGLCPSSAPCVAAGHYSARRAGPRFAPAIRLFPTLSLEPLLLTTPWLFGFSPILAACSVTNLCPSFPVLPPHACLPFAYVLHGLWCTRLCSCHANLVLSFWLLACPP